MSFAELLRHPPFQTAMLCCLFAVALLTGAFIWYFKAGKKREAEYNDKQKKHLDFRRRFVGPMIVGIMWMPHLTRNLPKLPLRNGEELPVSLLVCVGFPVVLYTIMAVAGRLVYGGEGRLKLRKDKPIHES